MVPAYLDEELVVCDITVALGELIITGGGPIGLLRQDQQKSLQYGSRTHRTVAETDRERPSLVELGFVIRSLSVTAKVDIVEVATADADPIAVTTAGSSYGTQSASVVVIAS